MPVTEVMYPDGRILMRKWEPNKRPNLDWLQKCVAAPNQEKGYIEGVDRFHDSVVAYANEEGRLLKLPVNVFAMRRLRWPAPPGGWAAYDGNLGDATWSPIVGPVVVLQSFRADPDEHGNDDPSDKVCPPDLGTQIEGKREWQQ